MRNEQMNMLQKLKPKQSPIREAYTLISLSCILTELQVQFSSIHASNNLLWRRIIRAPISLSGSEIQPTVPITRQGGLDSERHAPDH